MAGLSEVTTSIPILYKMSQTGSVTAMYMSNSVTTRYKRHCKAAKTEESRDFPVSAGSTEPSAIGWRGFGALALC